MNKEEEEEARIKTQEFNMVWQDCLNPQAAATYQEKITMNLLPLSYEISYYL
jgi:hypothetical protein